MIRTYAFRMALPALAAAAFLMSNGNVTAGPWGYGYRGAVGFGYVPSYYGYNLDDTSAGYYGGGRYREYYSYGRGYGIANYPGPLPGPGLPPDYRGPLHDPALYYTEPARPAASPLMQGDKVAHIIVEVPEDAEVWIEDQKTQQAGTSRWFVSPPLEPAQLYEYRIRAQWKEEGQTVEQTQKITVQPGRRATVGFPTGGKKEFVTTPRPFPLRDRE